MDVPNADRDDADRPVLAGRKEEPDAGRPDVGRLGGGIGEDEGGVRRRLTRFAGCIVSQT